MSDNPDFQRVREGEEYPIVGGATPPAGFTTTGSGYACNLCGSLTPLMTQWANKHLAWHREHDQQRG